jgi:hypothetical protein
MFSAYKKYLLVSGLVLVLAGAIVSGKNSNSSTAPVTQPADKSLTPIKPPALVPEIIPIEDNPLKDSIIAAGDYLVRQQLPNGELSYQVDFMTGERSYSPSHIRLMAGNGTLYTVCRVSGDLKYCNAGDLALNHYLELLVSNPEQFKGTCFYAEGSCQLGGAAMTVDAIYKRWQATGGFFLDDRNLLDTATELGYFIVSMRKPEGGFYHSYDPHFGGMVDPNFFVAYSSSEGLLALMQLYEMTGNDFWLTQAREVNAFMITQPVTEDHWHAYALSMLAKLDKLTKADQDYAKKIADVVIAGEVRSLSPKNTSISTATKVEALAALAQAFYLSGAEHEWLDPEIRTLITFVKARQLPDNNCDWEITKDTTLSYEGGIFSSCDEASIRIDGVQHWINGVTAYLEYGSMIGAKQH